MVDKELILAKASTLKKHLRRIEEKTGTGLAQFLENTDHQDVVLFNIQMAVQNCIDIAAHVISSQGLGVPGSYNEMFYILEENDYFDSNMTEKMVKAVGFRNLIVHEYTKLELNRAHQIIQEDIHDLSEFLKAVFKKVKIV